jgi:hypothetical protein
MGPAIDFWRFSNFFVYAIDLVCRPPIGDTTLYAEEPAGRF